MYLHILLQNYQYTSGGEEQARRDEKESLTFLIYSHLQCTSIHAHVLTWFNFNFMHQSLNIDPELYLNIHSGNLKNVLGQKDKQSCMHAFLQAVTAVKFPRNIPANVTSQS